MIVAPGALAHPVTGGIVIAAASVLTLATTVIRELHVVACADPARMRELWLPIGS